MVCFNSVELAAHPTFSTPKQTEFAGDNASVHV